MALETPTKTHRGRPEGSNHVAATNNTDGLNALIETVEGRRGLSAKDE